MWKPSEIQVKSTLLRDALLPHCSTTLVCSSIAYNFTTTQKSIWKVQETVIKLENEEIPCIFSTDFSVENMNSGFPSFFNPKLDTGYQKMFPMNVWSFSNVFPMFSRDLATTKPRSHLVVTGKIRRTSNVQHQ